MKGASVIGLLALAGCEQAKPPTPEGLKKIEARTATGTKITKLEVRPQPEIPRAGQVSIWDLKVFDIKDKPDGTRTEWKFFVPLPNKTGSITDVLMEAWMTDSTGKTILQTQPSYKAYGSFLTDFKIPTAGKYTLWVRYQPSQRGKVFPIETARKEIEVAP